MVLPLPSFVYFGWVLMCDASPFSALLPLPVCVCLLPTVELWDLLQQPDAVVYVCGDAKAMAKDVHRALCKVAEQQGKMSTAAAENWVKRLGDSGRYHKDVW